MTTQGAFARGEWTQLGTVLERPKLLASASPDGIALLMSFAFGVRSRDEVELRYSCGIPSTSSNFRETTAVTCSVHTDRQHGDCVRLTALGVIGVSVIEDSTDLLFSTSGHR